MFVVDPFKLIVVAVLGIPTEICGQFLHCMIGGLGHDINPRWQDLPLFVGSIVVAAAFAGWCIWKQDTVLETTNGKAAPDGRRESRVILITAFLASVLICAVAFPPMCK